MADIAAAITRGNRAFNERDEATMRQYIGETATFRSPGAPPTSGPDAGVAFARLWWQACSDARVEQVAVTVDGDTALEWGIFRGTHDGVLATPMGDIEPTGRSINGTYVWRRRFDGEKIAEAEILFDRMQLMQDLGLMPAPEMAGATG